MRRPPIGWFLAAAGLVAGSCLGSEGPTQVGPAGSAALAIQPSLIPSPANGGARSINRVRLIATRVSDGAVLGQANIDVDSLAAAWTLDFSVPLPVSPLDAMVAVSLLHVENGVESVEFSGVVGPLALTSGAAPLQPDVPLVRGPLANAFATGVSITSVPDTILEGVTYGVSATAATSGSTPPAVYWTSLDSAVLSAASSAVTGVAPGTGRVVASAGAFADTAAIVVRPAPTQVDVSPDTLMLAGAGAQGSFTAVVTDVRGDTLTNEPLTWSSTSPQVVTSLGGGLFQAVGPGTAVIEARPVSLPSVVGSGVVVVGGTAPSAVDVEVAKTVDRPQPLAGERITFTVTATNRGPGAATNVAVFDTLRASAFTSPGHTVSTGSVVGDSLWVIPQLDSGQVATWQTAVTVATGVAGGSATNTALLRSLAENESTPANDTARVTLNFPLSAVPVVQIINPADSSVFDPGDPIMFEASADDPEDGDLSPSIQWTSSIDGAIGTGRSFTTSTLRAGIHTIVAAATDTDDGTGADTIRVTVALYTMPATLNVPFTGTANLPITLGQPAPAGGVTLSVVSSAPSIANPTSATVFIPQGALSANATLSGVLPGTANITVGNPQFGFGVVLASVTAELDILGGNVSFASPFPQTLTVQFESQNVARSAPAGGIAVTMTSVDPACVSVTSPVTIPQFQTTTTATVSYGGTATLTCQTYVRATAPNITPDSVLVTVTAPPPIGITANSTVGAGLQDGATVNLGVSNHGGTTVTLASSDPTRMLVSPANSTPGSASIDVIVPNGTQSFTFYVQGINGTTGASTVTATATGFNQGTGNVSVVQPAIGLSGLPANTTTLSNDNALYAYVGLPSGNGVSAQNVRAGGPPIVATFAIDDTDIGLLKDSVASADTVTAVVPPGLYYSPTSVGNGGVAFDPLGMGTATVTVTAPGFIAQPVATASVVVSQPVISVTANSTVGAGLQDGASVNLGASNHGGVTVTVASSDPATALVSPAAGIAGTASIDVNVPNGSQSLTFYVHGINDITGTATVAVSAPGFAPDTGTVNVVQPAIGLAGLPANTTTLTVDNALYAYVGLPSGNGVSAQNVRAGGPPVVATFAIDSTSVGILKDSVASADTVMATVPPGTYYSPTSVANGGVAFDPLGVGTATVTVSAPGFIAQPVATSSINVSAPTITVTANSTVGAGLQDGASVNLGATNHGGVTVTLTSSDPTTVLVSPGAAVAGTSSIDVNVPNGSQSFTFYVHGIDGTTGSATVTATATGFNQGAGNVNVVQPAIGLAGLPANTTTLSTDNALYAYVGLPSGSGVSAQNVRAGGTPIVATFTIDNAGVGLLKDSLASAITRTATVPIGLYYSPTSVANGGVAFDPLGVGTATVMVSAPGFLAQPVATASVTVSAPAITVTATSTVGAGLQDGASVSLGANNHGGVTVTVTSSDPSSMLVAPGSTTAGTGSIDVFVPNGAQSFTFYVQGVEGRAGSFTVTAAASGFIDGTGTVNVVQPGLALTGLSSSLASSAVNDDFYAYVGVPSGNGVAAQNVRPGPGVTVTVTSSNPAAALVATQSASGGSVTVVIPPGLYYSPTSFAGGGATLDPQAVGQSTPTTVSVAAPGFVTTPAGSFLVTITP